jgi:hypothetical protein
MTTGKTPMALLLACILGAALCSCVTLEKTYPEKRFYRLVPRISLGPCLRETHPWTLVIRPLDAAPLYTGTSFVYQRDAFRYETDYIHEFAVPVPAMITDAMAESFYASPDFSAPARETGGTETLLLSGKVLEICGDFTREGKALARLDIRFSVTGKKEGGPALVEKTYSHREAVRDRSPEALTEGWNRGIETILTDLHRDICRRQGTP